jgi:hypothetical protein
VPKLPKTLRSFHLSELKHPQWASQSSPDFAKIDFFGIQSGDTLRFTACTLPRWLLMYFYFNFLLNVVKIFFLARCF